MSAKLVGIAKMSANNQIIIPKEIRELFKLKAGDRVYFYQGEKDTVIMAAEAPKIGS